MTTLNQPSRDELLQNKGNGMYNDLKRDRNDDTNWKPHSKRTEYYYNKPKTDAFVDVKRGLKQVSGRANARRNPLTEGEKPKLPSRVRKEPEISSTVKQINDKKFLRNNYNTRNETVSYSNKYAAVKFTLLKLV